MFAPETAALQHQKNICLDGLWCVRCMSCLSFSICIVTYEIFLRTLTDIIFVCEEEWGYHPFFRQFTKLVIIYHFKLIIVINVADYDWWYSIYFLSRLSTIICLKLVPIGKSWLNFMYSKQKIKIFILCVSL